MRREKEGEGEGEEGRGGGERGWSMKNSAYQSHKRINCFKGKQHAIVFVKSRHPNQQHAIVKTF